MSMMVHLSKLVCDPEMKEGAVFSDECPQQGAFLAVWIFRGKLFSRRAEWVGGGDGGVNCGTRYLFWHATSEHSEILRECKPLFFIQMKQES